MSREWALQGVIWLNFTCLLLAFVGVALRVDALLWSAVGFLLTLPVIGVLDRQVQGEEERARTRVL